MKVADVAEYIVIFVSETAKRYNLSEIQAYRYLRRHKAIEFIENQYDIAHTLSFNDMIDAAMSICQRNGGKLR